MKAEQFTSIVSHIRPRLLALASQFDADSAEDAVQEALMRLWTAWPQLAEPADAERLAVRLTKHACIDDYRRRQRQAQMNSAQIAAATGINSRSVSTMLSSARHHLCETLKKGGFL